MKLQITQVKSTIGRQEKQRRTMLALGLKKIGDSVEHEDTPQIRGMIFQVKHLVEVVEK